MDFWEDLEGSVANLVRDLLMGRDVTRLAAKLGKSDDLLYKWANPNCGQLPSLIQFLRLMRLAGDYTPLDRLAAAAGRVTAAKGAGPAEMLRRLAAQLED